MNWPSLPNGACTARRLPLVILFIALASIPVLAHEGEPPQPHDLWTAWSFEPLITLSLVLSAWLYARGVRRMANRSLRDKRSLAFGGGWLGLVVALVSPLDAVGSALFAAHMTQHEVLMLVAAPLLVLGRPLAPWLSALSIKTRRALADVSRVEIVRRAWRWVLTPPVAWLLHAAILWVWHAPALFQATLTNEWLHAAQHASFLFSALLFYEALAYGVERGRAYGAAVIYIFTTAVHTSILGALLTFATTLWYPVYAETTAAWGLAPLEDQQLGGLIMWVPAGVVYVIAGLAFFALWLHASERRAAVR